MAVEYICTHLHNSLPAELTTSVYLPAFQTPQEGECIAYSDWTYALDKFGCDGTVICWP